MGQALLTAVSDSDPITSGGDKTFQKTVPGAANREHVTLTGAGHFLQEDLGHQFAATIAGFIATT